MAMPCRISSPSSLTAVLVKSSRPAEEPAMTITASLLSAAEEIAALIKKVYDKGVAYGREHPEY